VARRKKHYRMSTETGRYAFEVKPLGPSRLLTRIQRKMARWVLPWFYADDPATLFPDLKRGRPGWRHRVKKK
jgi:hypothetical protein